MPQAETKPLARSRSISPAATAKRARVGQGAMVEASPAPQPPSDPAAQARNSEFVRLLQQALSDLGHCSISEQVAVATGVASEHAHIRTMRKQIEAGQWLDACESIRLCPDVTTQQCSCVQFVLLREHVLEVRICSTPCHWCSTCKPPKLDTVRKPRGAHDLADALCTA